MACQTSQCTVTCTPLMRYPMTYKQYAARGGVSWFSGTVKGGSRPLRLHGSLSSEVRLSPCSSASPPEGGGAYFQGGGVSSLATYLPSVACASIPPRGETPSGV